MHYFFLNINACFYEVDLRYFRALYRLATEAIRGNKMLVVLKKSIIWQLKMYEQFMNLCVSGNLVFTGIYKIEHVHLSHSNSPKYTGLPRTAKQYSLCYLWLAFKTCQRVYFFKPRVSTCDLTRTKRSIIKNKARNNHLVITIQYVTSWCYQEVITDSMERTAWAC